MYVTVQPPGETRSIVINSDGTVEGTPLFFFMPPALKQYAKQSGDFLIVVHKADKAVIFLIYNKFEMFLAGAIISPEVKFLFVTSDKNLGFPMLDPQDLAAQLSKQGGVKIPAPHAQPLAPSGGGGGGQQPTPPPPPQPSKLSIRPRLKPPSGLNNCGVQIADSIRGSEDVCPNCGYGLEVKSLG